MKNRLIRENSEDDRTLTELANRVVNDFKSMELHHLQELKLLKTKGEGIKQKAIQEIDKINAQLEKTATRFSTECNAQLLHVLDYISDNQLRSSLERKMYASPTTTFTPIEIE